MNQSHPQIALSLIFVLFFIGCSSTPRDAEERAELHLRIGTALLSQGKYPAALGELLVAKELDPNNPLIYNNLALAYFVRERLDLAEQNVREALRLKSDYTEAQNNLGRILLEQNRIDEALIYLNKALQDLTYSDVHQIQLNLGYAHFLNKDFKKSISLLEKVLRVDRENCFALTLLGKCHYQLRNWPQATEILDAAIRGCSEEQRGEPLFFAGKAYQQFQDLDRAHARFEQYLTNHRKEKYASEVQKINELIKQRLHR